MTTNRKSQVQIRVTSKRAVVKVGRNTVAEGVPAIVIIAIILAIKLMLAITRSVLALLTWLLPILFRFVIRRAVGVYLWFQAFYTQ